jgi:seryl-tRNA synthetase
MLKERDAPGDTAMPTPRDDQLGEALKEISKIMQQNRSEILSRTEYERRHEELQREMERRVMENRERMIELAARIQRVEDRLDAAANRLTTVEEKRTDNTISSQRAMLMLILGAVISASLGIIGTLLVIR